MVSASRFASASIAENWVYFRAFPAEKVDLLITGNELVQNAPTNLSRSGLEGYLLLKSLTKSTS